MKHALREQVRVVDGVEPELEELQHAGLLERVSQRHTVHVIHGGVGAPTPSPLGSSRTGRVPLYIPVRGLRHQVDQAFLRHVSLVLN